MSKKQRNGFQQPNTVAAAQVAQDEHEAEPVRAVPVHRQCPICYDGYGGTGTEKWWRRVSGTTVRRCYTCDQCAYNWTVEVKTHVEVVKIEHREVELKTRGV